MVADMKTKKVGMVVALAMMAAPAGAADWWVASERGMPDYVADGYQVVGFAVVPEASRVMPLLAMRYVLQKGASVVACTEKYSATTIDVVLANCYELRKP